jgi:nitrate/TMAO reductase-like tetraheme cytochrome c subunit
MSKRRIDPRRIKIHGNYTVEEAAKVIGAHKNSVRLWIKQGLPKADERLPTLLLGKDIRAFLENRKAKRKHRLSANQFYCVTCRAPKTPAKGMVDYVPSSSTLGNLKALCPDCQTIMNKRASLASLSRIKGDLDVKIAASAAAPKREE